MKSVTKLFLSLAQRLTPSGHEHTLYRYLPEGYTLDAVGNAIFSVGIEPKVLFCCHMDTFLLVPEPELVDIRMKHGFFTTGGMTNLGADDKAGMALMLDMIQHHVPGLYAFFVGEEIGCVGSTHAANEGNLLNKYSSIKAVVAFDRRGTSSVVTHQRGIPVCTSAAARSLCNALNRNGFRYAPDAFGGRCDSSSFHTKEGIEVCTNISVGYYDEHTRAERLDINHLTRLARAARQIDWNEALDTR